MIEIREVQNKDMKAQITLTVMNALPDWFSPPEDIIEKSKKHKDYPFFAAFDGDRPIGFVTLKIHNIYTADIFTLGILKQYHRQGIGHSLVEKCNLYCVRMGYKFLTVKTLDESADYEPYNGTRKFYRSEGFYPLEIFKTFWDEENPCLFLVKVVER